MAGRNEVASVCATYLVKDLYLVLHSTSQFAIPCYILNITTYLVPDCIRCVIEIWTARHSLSLV